MEPKKLELWEYSGLMHKAQIFFNQKMFSVYDYGDGFRQIWDLTGNAMHQMPYEEMQRWYNEDINDLIERQLEWLIEDILPKKLEEVDRVIREIKELKEYRDKF